MALLIVAEHFSFALLHEGPILGGSTFAFEQPLWQGFATEQKCALKNALKMFFPTILVTYVMSS